MALRPGYTPTLQSLGAPGGLRMASANPYGGDQSNPLAPKPAGPDAPIPPPSGTAHASGPLNQRIDPMTGLPYPSTGVTPNPIPTKSPKLPWGIDLPAIPDLSQLQLTGGTPDFSRNYLGMAADNTRPIERIAVPGELDQGSFKIGGLDQYQAGLGDVLGRSGGIAQGADAAGMAANAAQSRAAALGALTNPGPSAGAAQAQLGGEMAARNAMAMARSGRGYGSAGQLRSATFAGQDAMAQANQQASLIRAQEEAQRRQQMLALSGQDLGALGQAFNTQLGAGSQGIQALGMQGQLSQAQQQALADRTKTSAGMQLDANKTNANFANYEQPAAPDNTWSDIGAATGAAGGAMAGLAALFALSDRSSKTDIRPTSLLGKFKRVGSHSYRYKDPTLPGAAEGDQEGPMADELRALGVTVRGRDGYERVDTGRLALKVASATGEMARKLEALGV